MARDSISKAGSALLEADLIVYGPMFFILVLWRPSGASHYPLLASFLLVHILATRLPLFLMATAQSILRRLPPTLKPGWREPSLARVVGLVTLERPDNERPAGEQHSSSSARKKKDRGPRAPLPRPPSNRSSTQGGQERKLDVNFRQFRGRRR